MLVIGMSGKAEHGKSIASRVCKERGVELGLGVQIFELSQVIYDWCVLYGKLPAGLDRAQMTNEQVAELIKASDYVKKTFGPTYWMKNILDLMYAANPDVAICPNLRRPEEALLVHQGVGGVVWRINRLNADGSQYISTTRDPNHELETGLDRWPADHYLINITNQSDYYVHMIRATFDFDTMGIRK